MHQIKFFTTFATPIDELGICPDGGIGRPACRMNTLFVYPDWEFLAAEEDQMTNRQAGLPAAPSKLVLQRQAGALVSNTCAFNNIKEYRSLK